MSCPFLQEGRVRYCHAAPVRKMLMQAGPAGEERCSSPAYVECLVYQGHEAPGVPRTSCPFLHESHVQFCAASAMPKPVPYSESTLTRCGQSGYHYCELYTSFAQARGYECVEGIELPPHLKYTPNHMWIDVSEDGTWRVGIDALLAHCLGTIDGIAFLTHGGLQRPSVVLTSGGTDLHLTFPHPLPISSCNVYLRADPSRVASAPYTQGWLFRGDTPPERMPGLLSAAEASRWMLGEVHRASKLAHSHLDPAMPADGGTLERGFVRLLEREQRLRFLNEMFSSWGRG